MDASSLAQTAALLGIDIPEDRAAGMAADLAKLAERLRAIGLQPDFEAEPSGFPTAQQ